MKQEKLDSILDTAKKMFARYGLRKTSVDEVARMARVAKATIYNYFGSKDQVYLEVLRREMDEIEENRQSKISVYAQSHQYFESGSGGDRKTPPKCREHSKRAFRT